MDQQWCERVDNRLNGLSTAKAVADVHDKNVEKRLSEIEDTLRWLVRLIVGAMLAAAVGFAINGGMSFV